MKAHEFCHSTARPQKVTDFIHRSAESLRSIKLPESKGGIIAVLDAPMTLLYWISRTRPNLVFGGFAQFFLNCPWVGGQAIGSDFLWAVPMQLDGLGKEGFGSVHITRLTEANIHEVTILINASVEIAPHAFHSDICFVNEPDLANLAFPFCPYLFGKMRQKPFLPIPHGFMGELEASEQEALGHISIAEFVAHAAEQHLKDDVGGDFDKIEGCDRALIEGAPTGLAPKHAVAQTGFPLKW